MGGESRIRLETHEPMAIISTRTAITFGTWNVKTMFKAGKTAQVVAEMINYNLTVLAIIEAGWIGFGQRRLATGELLLYSGHEEDNALHIQGVALMLSKAAQRVHIGWVTHGPRILKATFLTKKRKINMDVIQCYAPTNESNEVVKKDFYSRLSTLIQNCPRRNITIMTGDFNTQIGSDNRGYGEIVGQHGLGEMNDNRERLANLCSLSNLVTGGNVCQHKRVHKATWVSPNLSTENQIDHVCIGRKSRRSLLDVCVEREDVMSDHPLLTVKLKLKLKRNWTGDSCQRPRYDTTMLLKDTTKRQEVKIVPLNKVHVLEELLEEETINEK